MTTLRWRRSDAAVVSIDRLHQRLRALPVALLLVVCGLVPVAAAPREVQNLVFTASQTMGWSAAPGASGYHAYVGVVSSLGATTFGSCLIGSIQGTTAPHAAVPSVGSVFVYQVSGFDETGEGGLGTTSGGTLRNPSPRCLPARRYFSSAANGDPGDGVIDGDFPRRNPSANRWGSLREEALVALHTGEFRLTDTDLALPGRGLPGVRGLPETLGLRFVRNYGSQQLYDGPLGHGWDFTYGARLLPLGSDVEFADGEGRTQLFQRIDATRFTSPVGLYAVLRQNGDASFTLRDPDGTLRRFHAFDGTNRSGSLESIEDRRGDRITFAYDHQGLLTTITDPLGRGVTVSYDAAGRIAALSDFAGRSTVYTYDGAGNLAAVRSPIVVGTPNGNDFPAGRTTGYQYSTGSADPLLAHNMIGVVAPNEFPGGPAVIQNSYGGPGSGFWFDRVVTQSIGGTNGSGVPAGGTLTYSYESLNPGGTPADPDLPRRRAIVHDRNGNEQESIHNFNGNRIALIERTNRELRPGEPDYLTGMAYNADGEVLVLVNPAGNEVHDTYDSPGLDRYREGNLLERREIADPRFLGGRGDGHGGEMADAVTTYTYEPVYNRLQSETDPRGNDPLYVPPNGGPTSPARYRRLEYFDHQEGLPVANGLASYAASHGIDLTGLATGLGDLNDDGGVAAIAGNTVRIESPAVALAAGSMQAGLEGDLVQDRVTRLVYNARSQPTAVVDAEGNRNEYGYHPETDPDGDGVPSPAAPDGRILDPATGGFLAFRRLDVLSQAARNNGVNPTPADVREDYVHDPVGNRTGTVDGRGVLTRWIHNALDEVVEIRRAAATAGFGGPLGDPQTGRGEGGLPAFGYRIWMARDANGNLVHGEIEDVGATRGAGPFVDRFWDHDILDRLIAARFEGAGASQLVTGFAYDPNENLVLVTKPEGNATEWAYDERNLILTRTRGALGPRGGAPSTRSFAYDANRNGLSVVDGRGGLTTFEYDGRDRLVRTLDTIGNTADLFHDPADHLVRVLRRGPVGGPTPPDRSGAANVDLADALYRHDEAGRLFQVDARLFLPSGAATTRPAMLQEGPLTPGDGFVTTRFEHDRDSRRTFVLDDAGGVLRWDYDGLSRPLRLTDVAGDTWSWTYDANHNGIELMHVESPSTLPGPPAQTTFTTAFYDALDRQSMVVDNLGQTRRWAFDALDDVLAMTDANGPVTLIIQRRSPGVIQSVGINGHGNVTRYEYDPPGRNVRTIQTLTASGLGNGTLTPPADPSNPSNPDGLITTETAWDGNSLVLIRTDDRGHATTYDYDNLDHLTGVTFDDGTSTATSYDAEDNPIAHLDANGSSISRFFDAGHRVLTVGVVPGPGVEGTTSQQFQYDGLGRMTRAIDNNSIGTADDVQVIQVFDSLGRPLEERQTLAFSPTLTTDVGWLAEDRRTSIIYPSGRTLDLDYDVAGRLRSVADPSHGEQATFEYFGLSRVHTRTYGNGTRSTHLDDTGSADIGFDAARRPILLRHLAPGNTLLAGFEGRYDRVGSLVSTRRQHHVGPSATRMGELLQFDSVGRVRLFREGFLTAAHALFSSPTDQQGWTLDGAGNWASFQRNGVVYLDQPNNNNEYDEPQSGGTRIDDGIPDDFADPALTPSPDGRNLTHDKNGNQIGNGVFSFKYDFRNRLVRAIRLQSGLQVGACAYDGLGRLIQRIVTNSGSLDEARRYAYDPSGTSHAIEERESSLVVRQLVVDGVRNRPLWQLDQSGGSAYFLEDLAGNTAALLNAAGTDVLERVTYDAYGRPVFETSSNVPLTDVFGAFVSESPNGNTNLFRGWQYLPELGARTNNVATDIAGHYLDRFLSYDPNMGRNTGRSALAPWSEPVSAGNAYAFALYPTNGAARLGAIRSALVTSLEGIPSFHALATGSPDLVSYTMGGLEDELEKILKEMADKFEKAAEELGKKGAKEGEHAETLKEILETLKSIHDKIDALKKAKEEGQKAADDPLELIKSITGFLNDAIEKLKKAPGPQKIIAEVLSVYVKALDSSLALLGPNLTLFGKAAIKAYENDCAGMEEAERVKCAMEAADTLAPGASAEDKERTRKHLELKSQKNQAAPPK